MNKNVVNMEDEIFRFSRFTDLMKVLTGMRIDFSAFCSSSACCIEIRVSQGTVCLMFNPSEDLEAITCYTTKTSEVKVDSVDLYHSRGMLFIRGYKKGSEVCLLINKTKRVKTV